MEKKLADTVVIGWTTMDTVEEFKMPNSTRRGLEGGKVHEARVCVLLCAQGT